MCIKFLKKKLKQSELLSGTLSNKKFEILILFKLSKRNFIKDDIFNSILLNSHHSINAQLKLFRERILEL